MNLKFNMDTSMGTEGRSSTSVNMNPGQGRHVHWHKHAKSVALSLWGITTFALVLSFTHEEEFTLLALAVEGINPLVLMISYTTAVMMALIGTPLMCIKA